MQPATSEWIAKAEGDFTTALREHRARKSPNYDAACFHAQQCAEKHLPLLRFLRPSMSRRRPRSDKGGCGSPPPIILSQNHPAHSHAFLPYHCANIFTSISV